MLPNGNVLIAAPVDKNVLMEYSEDGKCIRDMPCFGCPFDLTVIDSDRIAVTYQDRCIKILKKHNTIKDKFESEEDSYGILYKDNTIIIITQDGIKISDVEGKVLKTLTVHCGSYIETAKDIFYFTVDNAVHCISMLCDEI